jgi:hypothetical protein
MILEQLAIFAIIILGYFVLTIFGLNEKCQNTQWWNE